MNDSSANIFDLSGQSSKKKPLKPKPPAATPTPPPQEIPKELPNVPEDVKNIFEKMRAMQKELLQKFDETCKRAGKDPRDVKEFCHNPSNFSAPAWHIINERKEILQEKIGGVSRTEIKQRKAQKEASKTSKERKGKTLGARKKWIDMR